MTIRQYIQQKMAAFGKLSDADLVDSGLALDSEYSEENAQEVGIALCSLIGERVLAPYVSNVSENGFSMSWNRDNLGKYYLWLCRKYGVTPNDDVLSMLGVSLIRDMSHIW